MKTLDHRREKSAIGHSLVVSNGRVPGFAADITPEWLTAVLRDANVLPKGDVISVRAEIIGDGLGFSSSLVRLNVRYDKGSSNAPNSFVAKLPSLDPKTRAWTQLFNRFEREIRFYQQLSDECAMPTARCYYADMQSAPREASRGSDRRRAAQLPQWLKSLILPIALWASQFRSRPFMLLLEDLSSVRPGNQFDGSDFDDATIAAIALAGLHAQYWGQPGLDRFSWLPYQLQEPQTLRANYDSNAARFYRDLRIRPPIHIEPLMRWTYQHMERIHAQLGRGPRTLLHGDFRLDNIFFRDGGIVAVDWDLVSRGPGILDWAYFVMGNLRDEIDETRELELLKSYHAALLKHGVTGIDFDHCLHEYRLAKLYTAFSTIARPPGNDVEDVALNKLMDCWNRRLFRRLPETLFDDLSD